MVNMEQMQQTFTLRQMRERDQQMVSFGAVQSHAVGSESEVKTRIPRGVELQQTRDYEARMASGLDTAEAFAKANIMQERDLKEFEDDKESQFSAVDKAYRDIEDFEDRMAQ